MDTTTESFRLDASLPTLQFLLDHGARPIIISHRGRPNGVEPKLSLKPLIAIVNQKLSAHYGSGTSIEWVENLRFDEREKNNDPQFAQELARRGDLYINNDFANSHRAHSSMIGIPKYLPSYAGLLLEKEITTLTKIIKHPAQPLVMIIGGIKFEDKLGVIENFKNRTSAILIGSSYKLTSSQDVNIVQPDDLVGGGLDIGPKTIEKYTKIILTAKTAIWNGPVGQYEDPRYAIGSRKIAEAIIASNAFSVIGGGNTIEFLSKIKLLDKFSFVSTGGGAMLEFLAGKKLAAIEALEVS